MRILFITRATLFKVKGGDTIQITKTAEYLQKLGLIVDIRLCNESIVYKTYDLIHFFNIIRPADILLHIKKSGKPYVISPILVDYSEYEKNIRRGLAGFLLRRLPPDWIEYAKVFARFVLNGEKIVSPYYILLGQKKSIQKIIRQAAMLLPNSQNEYKRLLNKYQVSKSYVVIPNAIDSTIFITNHSIRQRDDRLVICVGRIEGLKNQRTLIEALNDSAYKLIIIGLPAPNQIGYYKECKKIAASNISFIYNLPQEKLVEYYQQAKVHVLPSWFETTGLSSLEAAAMGCNIVVTDKGDTREYFEDYAYYCDPSSPASIFAAIEEAAVNRASEQLRTKIINNYTWDQAAAKTMQAYQEIFNINR